MSDSAHALPLRLCYNTLHQRGESKRNDTLLIVDDNREMRQLMKSIVSKACDEIFECETAMRCWTRLRPTVLIGF